MTKCFAVSKEEPMTNQPRAVGKSHIPPNSFLFEKIVPIVLIALGIITVGLMLFAAGVLLGVVHF